ncbi:hypothetical protein FH972_011159 [Carpinus fangiana]|uniref:Legume lectin domain-containing protein n=1 Tax=Carpinus fangiana TaxID=176857 RepID=A0A660KTG7_9ROSI|nr:hypothetical protein FH972_011159 [Carpinus fangiana]
MTFSLMVVPFYSVVWTSATGDDFRLPSDENSLLSPSSQVHRTEKTFGLNVTLSHEISFQLHSEHPTADRISYGFVGLEPSNHTLALREQDLAKRISTCGRLSCDEVQILDKNLQRKLDDGVFFLWCVRWCFDPGKNHYWAVEKKGGRRKSAIVQ